MMSSDLAGPYWNDDRSVAEYTGRGVLMLVGSQWLNGALREYRTEQRYALEEATECQCASASVYIDIYIYIYRYLF